MPPFIDFKLKFSIKAIMDPIEGLEKRIMRAILVALKKDERIVEPRVPSLPQKTPPNVPLHLR